MTGGHGPPRIRAMFKPPGAVLRPRADKSSGWPLSRLLFLPALLLLSAALAGSGSAWEGLVRSAFAPLCHQQVDRCLLLGGALPVCARCAGFYFGLAVVALTCSGRKFRPGLLLAGIPLVVDGGANLFGLWMTPAGLRALTGVLAAVPLGLLVQGDADEAR